MRAILHHPIIKALIHLVENSSYVEQMKFLEKEKEKEQIKYITRCNDRCNINMETSHRQNMQDHQ